MATVIFKNLWRMGKYQKTEKQETQCFYLKREIKKEPVQPAEFQFLKKTGTKKKKNQNLAKQFVSA